MGNFEIPSSCFIFSPRPMSPGVEAYKAGPLVKIWGAITR